MNNEHVWIPTASQLPPEGVEVEVLRNDDIVQRLVFDRGRWWFPDRSAYVYFTPRCWRIL